MIYGKILLEWGMNMYTPLYVKTNYSLLSSLVTIDDLIQQCKEKHISSVAITDNNMYGTMEFYHKCKKNGIKPILGLELILEEGTVLVYAKNYTGYQTLCKLATIQSERTVQLADLTVNNQEIIAVVANGIETLFKEVSTIIEDSYLGYVNYEQEQKLSSYKEKLLYLPKCLYLLPEEKEYLPYLIMIKEGKSVADEVIIEAENHSFYQSVSSNISNIGLYHTNKIASSCNVEFPTAKLMLPKYPCEKGLDEATYLRELSKAGLTKRLNGKVTEEYQKRLYYELETIQKMGFSNYFLVVYDFIKYAKKNGILVGPGRGSAAGSLVSYSLGITDIDPLQYNLLFERFLNPERVTMPDIDTDFPDAYRDEIIDYVVKKYGKKKVAGIITFGTLGVKQAIRDVSRTLNIPLYKVDQLCKFIPAVTKQKLTDFYRQVPAFKVKIDSDSQLTKMYKIACKIEGFPRHTSIHAAGIVMCEEPLDDLIPLEKNESMYLTGYSMEYLEELGLLKMDFLGLKNLTTIMNIIEDINKNTHDNISFQEIPMDDPDALEIFTTANTSGIFQFESAGMRNFLRKLKPTSFEDIFAAIALFRPGPAVNIDSYIRRKQGKEEITYLDPVLKPILENTYGILIYQEQIMQVANVLAGYSLGEADILRRAMSKKKFDLLQSEEEKFIQRSVARGHDKETVKQIFQLILNFAGYGFNRSHSVAYSIIAYKMAYLKAKYPTYFFSNLLSSVIGSEEKTKEYLLEARSNHIEILKPDIKRSTDSFQVTENGILFPLSNIRGIGSVASSEIVTERAKQPFEDLYDTIGRIYSRNVGRKALEALILSDSMKSFGYNKATLFANLDHLINYAELVKDLDPSLVMKPEIEVVEEYPQDVLLQQEKELFGFYISSHPVTSYRSSNITAVPINQLSVMLSKKVDVLVLVEAVKTIETKNKETMAFMNGSDETGTFDFVLFPKVYQQYTDIEKGDLIKVIGTVEKRLDRYQLVVQKIEKLAEKKEGKE